MIRVPNDREPKHPGAILREEFLLPMEITQQQLADATYVPFQRINELVNGKRGVTPSTPLRLAKLFGVSEGFWTNLQVCCELHSVRRKEQEILEKIKPTKVQPAGE